MSFADLDDEAYEDIARGVRTIARGYRNMFESSQPVAGEITPDASFPYAGWTMVQPAYFSCCERCRHPSPIEYFGSANQSSPRA